VDAGTADSAVAGVKGAVMSGRQTNGSALRPHISILLAGVATVVATPSNTQIRTVDLSESTVETVIPPTFDGGFFASIRSIVVNDMGIWVVDPGHRHVLWFDRGGALTVRFGREGSGPGEFMSPSFLAVDSLLTVGDPLQGRQVRFRLDGSHKETTRVPSFRRPNGREVPLMGVGSLRGGFTVGVIPVAYTAFRQGTSDFRETVVIVHPDNQSVDTVFSYRSELAAWQTETTASGRATPFGAAGAWSLVGDTAVVFADGIAGTLTVFKPQAGLFRADTFDLGLEARPVADRDLEDLEAVIRKGMALSGEIQIDAPTHWSVATHLIPDGDQVFWLKQAVEGQRVEWIAVNPGYTGEPTRVILPERFALSDVHRGFLYGVSRDELDVESVGRLVDPVAAGPKRGPG